MEEFRDEFTPVNDSTGLHYYYYIQYYFDALYNHDGGVSIEAVNASRNRSMYHFNVNTDYDRTEYILYYIMLPLVCIMGLVGIIITVLVLSRKKMFTSTNCYLISLAITDFLFLSLLCTRLLDQIMSEIGFYTFEKFKACMAIMSVFLDMFNQASIWITVLLGIERYIAICHPLRAVAFCTTSRARRIVIGLYIIIFLCRLPKFFDYKIISIYNPRINETIFFSIPSFLSKCMIYQILYLWLVDAIFSVIIPFSLLLGFNIRLMWEIHRSTKYLRLHLQAHSNIRNVISAEQIQLTLMLGGIVLAFLICQLPYIIYRIYTDLQRTDPMSSHNEYRVIWYLCLLFLGIKSAINFFLYCWFSEKFRVTFKHMFCMRTCLPRAALRRLSDNSHNPRHNSYLGSKDTTVC